MAGRNGCRGMVSRCTAACDEGGMRTGGARTGGELLMHCFSPLSEL